MAATTPGEKLWLTAIFFDRFERLRSGFRFLVFIFLFFLVAGSLGALVSGIFYLLDFEISEFGRVARIVSSILSLAAALLVGWLCAWLLERLPFRSLGASFTKNWFSDFVKGLIFGALALCLAVLIAVTAGGLRFELNAAAGQTAIFATLGLTFVLFFFGAAFEEAFVRGYMFQTLTRSGLAWLAIALTSLIFAAGHLGNEGANAFSTANTALAGIWLGIAYLKTRTLWFVTGLHLSWNWVQGSFFGVEVSGFDTFAESPILIESDGGPVWITGGEYGLEGGFAATIAIMVCTVAIWYLPFLKSDQEMVALTSPPAINSAPRPADQGREEISEHA